MSSVKPTFQVRELALPVYVPSMLFAAGESGLIPLIPASAEKLGADIPTAAFVAGLVLIGTLVADLPAHLNDLGGFSGGRRCTACRIR